MQYARFCFFQYLSFMPLSVNTMRHANVGSGKPDLVKVFNIELPRSTTNKLHFSRLLRSMRVQQQSFLPRESRGKPHVLLRTAQCKTRGHSQPQSVMPGPVIHQDLAIGQ